MKEKNNGNSAKDWGGRGIEMDIEGPPPLTVESEQSEIVGAQGLACASGLPPTEQSQGCDT
jgi:hypothetical protein